MWENSGLNERCGKTVAYMKNHTLLLLLIHPGTQPQKRKQKDGQKPSRGHCQSLAEPWRKRGGNLAEPWLKLGGNLAEPWRKPFFTEISKLGCFLGARRLNVPRNVSILDFWRALGGNLAEPWRSLGEPVWALETRFRTSRPVWACVGPV